MAAVVSAMAFTFMAVWWLRPAPAGPFVLVSIDTLRADRLPLYGYEAGRTPALDALAADAVVFDRAYAHAPQTLPSHASMFTGLLPFEHGVRDNLGFTLGADAPTLASLFQAAGYHTAGFVSAYVMRTDTGIARGFDRYDDALPAGGLDRSPGQIQRPGDRTLTSAIAWMDTLADDRFFLFFHIYEPHKPYAPPDRFAGMDRYDGEVSFSDEIVGQLLADLKRRGWYEGATVLVTADHGEGLGDHEEQEHGLFIYDEVIRVPWLLKLPAGRQAGRRIADPVQHIDIVPTFAALAGLGAPTGLRGRNLTPALDGRASIPPQSVYAEALYPRYHFGWSELVGLTDDRYRYIRAPREELYDLERDPDERTNLAAERPDTAAAMRAALDALVADRGVAAPAAVSAEDRQRLAALGYVGTQFSADAAPGSILPDPKDMVGVLRRYREAIDQLEARDFTAAARSLKTLVAEQPDMTDVWVQYAAVLSRLGRHADALEAYRQVVRLKPDEPNGLLGASATLVRLGRFEEARQHALLAVARAPATAHEALATIAIAMGDAAEALRQAELAAAAEPGLPLPAYVRGLLAYSRQRFAEALPHLVDAYRGWTGRTIQPADLRFYLGDTLARLERYAEAERYFTEELSLFPANVRARTGLAMLYQATGRGAEVERVIADMLRIAPSPDTYQTAVELWTMFGQPERAKAVQADARARFGGSR